MASVTIFQRIEGQWVEGPPAFSLTGNLNRLVFISLFSDRRAEAEEMPNPLERRGWWADTYRKRPLGSRLWMLDRAKWGQETLIQAQEFAEEALQWLVDEGAAQAVRVEAERQNDLLALRVEITRPDGQTETLKALWG
ncbi:MAG: phage GP46 family protein [Deltaproteobacteria bacterium]|nr:phage GP46 family protein [Deltaproteobacteria bacterium]